MMLCCGAVGGWPEREQCHLLGSPPTFSHFPRYPEANWALLVADSHVGGFVSVLGPCGSLQWTLLWGWQFLLPQQPPQIFSVRGFEVLFLCTGTLCCVACLAPLLFLLVYPHTNVGLPATISPTWSSSCCLASCPFHSGCPFPPLLPVWMNVSSLTPWLLDFHTVHFSGSSGCFLFLNLLLSFFWLYEKAKCIYLCFHIDQKSNSVFFVMYVH